jgi:hypothetical protein
MTKRIEISRRNIKEPVAYYSPSSGAVYWPGVKGRCLSKDGRSQDVDYSGIDFQKIGDYLPLYEGDTIRIISEETIVL